ncbi:MAG: CBS domain-containing protein [Candidatus Aenigmarchaeota archaeon]|nr:CBS domain-containing protein [Candidatus Aenigmarchaeota archaeon]
MATIFEYIIDFLLGRLDKRRRRRRAIKKIKKVHVSATRKAKRLKIKKRRHKRKIRFRGHRKVAKRPTEIIKKLEKVPKLQRKAGVRPKGVTVVKPKRKIRRPKRINVKELAAAFNLSTATLQEIYNKVKEIEANASKGSATDNVEDLKKSVQDLEEKAATSGATVVPEILDLINYTKQKIQDLEAGAAIPAPTDSITEAKNQIEELEREKKHLQQSQKVIEEKYYRRELDEVSFKKIMDDYESRLVEIGVKLKTWKQELAKLEEEAKMPEEKGKLPKILKPVMLKGKKKERSKALGIKLPKFKPSAIPAPLPEKIDLKKIWEAKIPKEVIKEVICADLMTKGVYTVRPNDTLNYVIRVFADKKISGTPVMNGNNLVGVIAESDILKFIGSKELLSRGSSRLKTLSEMKVEDVMHKNPVFVYEYTKLSEATDLINEHDITRLPVLNEKRHLVGILTKSDIMRGVSKELLFKILEKRELERILKVETDIDEILKIVERKGSIGVSEIKKRLILPEDKIEEWGKVLEKHNLLEMFYPPLGKPEFRKKIK